MYNVVQVHRCTRVYLHLCKIEVYYYYLIIFYTLPLLPRYLLYWFSVSVLVNCVRVHVDLVFFSFSLLFFVLFFYFFFFFYCTKFSAKYLR